MRFFLITLLSLFLFSCNNSGGGAFEVQNTGPGDIYMISAAVQYENADCSGSETFQYGMCTAEDENDPNAMICYFMNLVDDSQLVEQGCDDESGCDFISYSEMMPVTLTFFDDGTLDYSIDEFCSNAIITSENECIAQGNSWNPAISIEGTCNEDNNVITCNADMSVDPLTFVIIDSSTLIMQSIELDDNGEMNCMGIVLIKQ